METSNQPSKFFSLKNKPLWSDSRFAWFYAAIILVAVVLFAIILKVSGIYESMGWRIVNLFFILIGFILLVKDYNKQKKYQVSYTSALLLCIRTGFYFALLFLPALTFIIGSYPSEQALINNRELFNSDFPIQEIIFANYIETAATVVISSFVAAYFVGFGKSKN